MPPDFDDFSIYLEDIPEQDWIELDKEAYFMCEVNKVKPEYDLVWSVGDDAVDPQPHTSQAWNPDTSYTLTSRYPHTATSKDDVILQCEVDTSGDYVTESTFVVHCEFLLMHG